MCIASRMMAVRVAVYDTIVRFTLLALEVGWGLATGAKHSCRCTACVSDCAYTLVMQQ